MRETPDDRREVADRDRERDPGVRASQNHPGQRPPRIDERPAQATVRNRVIAAQQVLQRGQVGPRLACSGDPPAMQGHRKEGHQVLVHDRGIAYRPGRPGRVAVGARRQRLHARHVGLHHADPGGQVDPQHRGVVFQVVRGHQLHGVGPGQGAGGGHEQTGLEKRNRRSERLVMSRVPGEVALDARVVLGGKDLLQLRSGLDDNDPDD